MWLVLARKGHMRFTRKISFKEAEVREIVATTDSYLWIVVDVKRAIIAGGDEVISDLKQQLLGNGSKIHDIFGIGLDLVTGEIDYFSPINEKRFVPGSTKEVPMDKRERIETLINYFFEELPAIKQG